jgi:hypothetical protein
MHIHARSGVTTRTLRRCLKTQAPKTHNKTIYRRLGGKEKVLPALDFFIKCFRHVVVFLYFLFSRPFVLKSKGSAFERALLWLRNAQKGDKIQKTGSK